MNIFYSWQSDLTYKYNRNFIEDCLKATIRKFHKNFNLSYNMAPRLDQDVRGVSGTPDLASTIFSKIRNSDAYIGDLSYAYSSETRKFPNPNVMIELGFALSSLGDAKIINVMNTYFGTPDDLPFDLKHKKWPIQYKYGKDTTPEEKAKERLNLIEALYQALMPLLLDKINSENEDIYSISSTPSTANILTHILNSSSDLDWHVSTLRENILCAVYQQDVNLRMEIDLNKRIIEDFKESWNDKFLKPAACTYKCDIIYINSIVKQIVIVNTNDGTLIPLPQEYATSKFRMKNFNFKIGHIFDQSNTLIRDIRQADIEVELPIFNNSGLILE